MESKPKIPENKEPKGKFDTRANTLPPHVLESAKRGLEQFENDEGISIEEFEERHFLKHR